MLIIIEILGLLFLVGSIKTIKSIYTKDSAGSPKDKPVDPTHDDKSSGNPSDLKK